ncbi:MAG: hypothetical protein K2X70_14330 [Candidatus Obscuribacterales bacterium]|nr:hypothetical protein [Candidatus Obscuribacterales bacterium]
MFGERRQGPSISFVHVESLDPECANSLRNASTADSPRYRDTTKIASS